MGKSTDESSTVSHRSDFSTKLTDSLDSDLSPNSESIITTEDGYLCHLEKNLVICNQFKSATILSDTPECTPKI